MKYSFPHDYLTDRWFIQGTAHTISPIPTATSVVAISRVWTPKRNLSCRTQGLIAKERVSKNKPVRKE
jgi:hypothetical protein